MSWVNYDEVVSTLRAEGFDIEHLEIGRMTRVKRPGHDQKGWYVVHEIMLDNHESALIGSYGYWSGAESFSAKISAGRGRKLTEEQRKAIDARHKAEKAKSEAERKRSADEAAAVASRTWAKYVQEGRSDYLQRKGVGAHGLRFSPSGNGTVAVPMQDAGGRILGLQIIRGKDRGHKLEKEYWPKGLAKKGAFHLIGIPRDIVLLAEGYATGATLHEATGLPVAVAFDAGNLMPVAEALKKHYKRIRILVCADDDYLTEGNPGCEKAQLAALAVGGAWCRPEFPSDRGGKKLTDFNDLANFPDGGTNVVRTQIEAIIAAAGWSELRRNRLLQGNAPDEGEGGSRRRAVSVMQVDDIVERFIFIDEETGEFVFDTWERSVCKYSKITRLLPAGVRNDEVKRHPLWQGRAVYIDQIGFDPGGEDKNIVCNRWNGWPMSPKPGKCTVLLSLLEYLCTGENNHRELYHWILKWLAYPIQHPGAKMHSALVVHGPQGTGKSRFFEAVSKIYGDYSIILNQGAIEDKFNADWAERKLYVVADEIVANTEKYHLKNQLKNFITGEWVRVNPKNVAAHRERNHMNIVFLSNEKQPVILENDDRRHCVIYTPEKLEEDFYSSVTEEIADGGIEALHQYLVDLDLGDFKPWTKPPMTEAKRELIAISMGSDETFVREWISGDHEALPFCPASKQQIYSEYQRWCRREGEPRPRRSKDFFGTLEKQGGWFIGIKDRYPTVHFTGSKISYKCVIPPAHLIEQASLKGKDFRKKPDQTQAEWLTDCFFAVENAWREASVGDDST